MEIKGQCGTQSSPDTFFEEAGRALYGFVMDTDGLDSHLEMMKEKYQGKGVANWVGNVTCKKGRGVLHTLLIISYAPAEVGHLGSDGQLDSH